MKKKIEITYEQVALDELPDKIKSLINSAEKALLSSHAPYSNFHVGAALLLNDGSVVRGSNQENASFPVGFCAERTALAAKFAQAPDSKIQALAIAVLHKNGQVVQPVAPCGMCRQALLEEENRQQKPMTIYLSGNNGLVMIFESAASLLPFRFDESVLRQG
jgi:cytidine deaminase